MTLLWGIVILVVANFATIGAMLLVRRGAPEGSYFTDGDRASGVFGVLAGGFAIFAGFIIFLAFTSYDESRSGGEAEAITVVQQFETAELLPPAVQNRLTGELVCYGRSVVHREWPQMENGDGGDTINPWTIALSRSLKVANPTTAGEQAAYSKWLDQTSDREQGRSDRLHGAEGIIPGTIWLVLFLIAGVVFAFMLFFADSGEGRGRSGDADGIGNYGDPAHVDGDQRARPPAPRRSGANQTGGHGAVAQDPGERARRREGAGSTSVRLPRRSGLLLTENAGQAASPGRSPGKYDAPATRADPDRVRPPTNGGWMEGHDEELGPIDIVVIAWPAGSPMTGEAFPLLLDLVDRGIIRVLDAMLVKKEEDGIVRRLRGKGP